MATRYFALILGVALVAAGIGGFLPVITQPVPAEALQLTASTSYGLLLGLFPINLFHNLFHLASGLLGVFAFRKFSHAHAYARFMGVTLGLLTVLGLIGATNTLFGWAPLYGHDIWLHGAEALVGLYLGFGAPVSNKPSPTQSAKAPG